LPDGDAEKHPSVRVAAARDHPLLQRYRLKAKRAERYESEETNLYVWNRVM
jgi:hypothetical protein